MGHSIKISIIIPARNEEKIISETLRGITAAFQTDYEVIVVLDNCTDRTSAIVEKTSLSDTRIKRLDLARHSHKGGAIIEGFKAARGEYIGFMDADSPFDLASLRKEIERYLYSNKTDCLIFSKWKGRNFFQVNEPLLKKILSRFLNLICRKIFRLKFYDTQGGAKFLSRENWLGLSGDFLCRDYIWDVEFLLKLQNMPLRIEEIFVADKNLRRGFGYFWESWKMFFSLLKLRVCFRKG